nr:MAG TPA: hypothetical protein [Caudoviricetes sp.]
MCKLYFLSCPYLPSLAIYGRCPLFYTTVYVHTLRSSIQ